MVFISLPNGEKLSDYEDFVYDKSAGTNIMVYIVDTGADLRNDDEFSKFVRTNVRWLHAFGAFPQDTTENDITDGVLWERSKVDPPNQGDVIKVYAPCHDITVPNAITGGYRAPAEVEGVSYASGTIAGLGTYFLGLSSLASSLHDDDPTKRVQKLKELLQTGSCLYRTPDKKACALYNLADPRTCPPDVPPDFKDGDEIGCKDTSSTSANTVVAIPGCFITTASLDLSSGTTAPQPECSCQGGAIAGIGSGTVSGTTYSWCQTGGLPTGVPPEATNPATTIASEVSQCVQATPDSPKPAVTCSTSTTRNDVTTPLPDGNFACTNFCFCQIDGEPRVCTTAGPGAKREVQPFLNGAPEPTAAPVFAY